MSGQADASRLAAEEERFLVHLGRAGDLVGSRRLEEAEVEVLRALSILPSERRALNLLALIRFKLGRVDEAWETYKEIATIAPSDAGVRLNLGLLALKLERIDDAVVELERAGELVPDDLRVWSYLGFAYARKGQGSLAAAAFRRAGQEGLAAEVERSESRLEGDSGQREVVAAPVATPAPAEAPDRVVEVPLLADAARAGQGARESSGVDAPALEEFAFGATAPGGRVVRRDSAGGVEVASESPQPQVEAATSLATFALGHLLPMRSGPALERTPLLRWPIFDETYVRAASAMVATGDLQFEAGLRRERGRWLAEPIGDARPMCRVRGQGEVWLALDKPALVTLILEEDILFVREDRVVAFDGEVSWESGRLPNDGTRFIQFRGRGRVVLEIPGEPVTVKLEPNADANVARDLLIGWIGRVVPRGGAAFEGGPRRVACSGEGMLVLEGRSA